MNFASRKSAQRFNSAFQCARKTLFKSLEIERVVERQCRERCAAGNARGSYN
jgi:hypothetical protein